MDKHAYLLLLTVVVRASQFKKSCVRVCDISINRDGRIVKPIERERDTPPRARVYLCEYLCVQSLVMLRQSAGAELTSPSIRENRLQ